MKEERRNNVNTFCLVLCTATFMIYTYLYRQDVNIKRKMCNTYDIDNTDYILANTSVTIDDNDEESVKE